MSTDLKRPTVIVFKGGLFLLLGLVSGFLLISSIASVRNLILLGLTIWSFCRFYYFLFYVLEHYVDSSLRYRGIWDLLVSMFRQRR
ncbi:MAG: hypothetical protein AAGJ40_01065 [Planctomycetota bacterium]